MKVCLISENGLMVGVRREEVDIPLARPTNETTQAAPRGGGYHDSPLLSSTPSQRASQDRGVPKIVAPMRITMSLLYFLRLAQGLCQWDLYIFFAACSGPFFYFVFFMWLAQGLFNGIFIFFWFFVIGKRLT